MGQTMTENPLLVERFPIPFDAVKAEHVEPAIEVLLKQMRNRIKDLAQQDIPRTYANILLVLDRATEPLDYAMAVVRHLESVATTPELRAAADCTNAEATA